MILGLWWKSKSRWWGSQRSWGTKERSGNLKCFNAFYESAKYIGTIKNIKKYIGVSPADFGQKKILVAALDSSYACILPLFIDVDIVYIVSLSFVTWRIQAVMLLEIYIIISFHVWICAEFFFYTSFGIYIDHYNLDLYDQCGSFYHLRVKKDDFFNFTHTNMSTFLFMYFFNIGKSNY